MHSSWQGRLWSASTDRRQRGGREISEGESRNAIRQWSDLEGPELAYPDTTFERDLIRNSTPVRWLGNLFGQRTRTITGPDLCWILDAEINATFTIIVHHGAI